MAPLATTRAGGEAEAVAVCQERAAQMLGVSSRTLQNWRAKGIIAGSKPAGPGGKVLYAVDEVRRVAAGRTEVSK